MEMMRDVLTAKMKDAEKILVGIGAEWKTGNPEREKEIASAAKTIHRLIEGKDYFVISTLSKEELERLNFDSSNTVTPLDVSLTEDQWNHYTQWLCRTLNRKLVLLELGEGFFHPSLIRWPFEKTAGINHKAHLYRIHKTFYQITDEISEKATAIKEDSVVFFARWD